MDDLGFNKIAGAVLATGLGIMILTKLPGVLMDTGGEEIAYKVGPIDTGNSEEDEVELPFPQAEWVAAMDAAKGARVFKKCQSCHNVEAGGPNGTGPGLYGVVGNDKAAHEGYAFSAALAGTGGQWTYESLDLFLTKPSAYAPGTKMNFVGLRKPEDRAAVIEYMRVADSDPSPRPTPAVIEPVIETEVAIEEPAEDPTE
jgi:cytochrome c